MVELKPVTRKPSWLNGVILPSIAGIPFGYLLREVSSPWGWYVVAGWQTMCGLAVAVERAPKYGAGSLPQAQRLCELLGLQWICMGVVTAVAGRELTKDTSSAPTISILATSIVSTFAFSIAAGPTRRVNANDNEMKLVPMNSFLMAFAATSLCF